MTMPIDLVLVRHGESEGNVARRSSAAGDNSVFTEEFCGRHNSRFRLTDRGREQARAAGAWLREIRGAIRSLLGVRLPAGDGDGRPVGPA